MHVQIIKSLCQCAIVVSLIIAVMFIPLEKKELEIFTAKLFKCTFFLTERLKELERLVNNFFKEKDSTARRKYLIQIQRKLVKSQEYGDDKLQLVGNMIDLVRAV